VNREIVVDVQQTEISIALLEDKSLVELNKESIDTSFAVGDIFLGRVKKIMPGLNAAFVDVGYGKDAFIHYLDLGNNFRTINSYAKRITENKKTIPVQKVQSFEKELVKEGSIADALTLGQNILVQITKEPISTKGPRLTSEISIAGRFLVLIPFDNKISVSQKIKSKEERNRLRQLIQSVKPKNFGVIVRTVAEGKMVAELDSELKFLIKRWEEAVQKMSKSTPPALLLSEMGRAVSILRDIFNTDFESIYINDRSVYEEIRDYVALISPEQKNIVKLYQSEIPIFDNFNITKQLKSSFGRTVSIKSGAYLIIEHTEALHVIDVNSGNRTKSSNNQETNALEVNLAAAAEIARQLRLRDVGGIIVIDFIDLQSNANKQILYDKMRECMAADRTKHKILPLSKFGLMQITRQRVRPEMRIKTEETCPNCDGKGKIQPSILFTDELEQKIDFIVKELKIKKFTLYVHPYVYAFINQGLFSLKLKWKFKYSFGIQVHPMQNFAFLQSQFLDENKQEIDMTNEVDLQNINGVNHAVD
jgi:ribonuclease G